MSEHKFPKPVVVKATPRTWEIPSDSHREILGMIDEITVADSRVKRYDLFLALEGLIPETSGVVTQVKLRGWIPYVEEVLDAK